MMKAILRTRAEEEEVDKLTSSPITSKDLSFRLVKVVTFLVIFVSGMVLGLAATAHVTRYFTSSHHELFFSPIHVAQVSHEEDCLSITKYKKEEDCLNLKSFINPGHLTHSMTDDELLWRASLVPKKEVYPYKRVPKVAFMFLTRGPLPLSPLWDRFFQGHENLFSVYVHALPGYELNVSRSSAFYGRQIPSQDVQWGSVTLSDGERRLLANALLDFSNERRKMLPDIKLFQWRKGSQWFELNRTLAVNIVADDKYYSLFRKYCKPSCYPDEHYLPTFLNMFYGSMNANRSVTWVDWSRGGPHPATFGKEDITEGFIQSIKNNGTTCSYNSEQTLVCYLFARKFAPSALEPLLNLTSTVLRF
uniref:Uncharacterized protein n=1 Tax=Nelumbo nucifera TaxID=4432 RepID=A0A822ZVH1_NELNU|nr:TPA_asm: hypothetical protein HUJ06_004138 [Nelumbo nucifera]